MLVPSYVSIGGVRLSGLAFLGGIAGGGGGYALAFGATFNPTGRHASANGEAVTQAIAPLDPRSQITAPAKGKRLALAWASQTADGTTVFKIKQNGITVATLNATGVEGVIEKLPIPTAPGDLYAIEFDAGTSPGRTTFVLLVE
jgi:hypothetical protein